MVFGSETAPVPEAPLVLVADDDRASRVALMHAVSQHGLRAECVEDGQAAVERVGRGGVTLVILAQSAAAPSAEESCAQLKKAAEPRRLPVLLLTTKNDVESRILGLCAGADDFMSKPFDERELLLRVDNMLRSKKAHDAARASTQRLEELCVHDELTGVYNFRHMHVRLDEEFKRAHRYRTPLACAMIDIDRFKRFNEQFGHDAGNQVLREVSSRIAKAVRDVDTVARYGGEEFLLVLPNTHFAGALSVADRVWRAVGESHVRVNGAPHRITISMGVSLFPGRDIKTKEQLLKSADEALYRAKNEGRDRICLFQQQSYMYRPSDTTPETR